MDPGNTKRLPDLQQRFVLQGVAKRLREPPRVVLPRVALTVGVVRPGLVHALLVGGQGVPLPERHVADPGGVPDADPPVVADLRGDGRGDGDFVVAFAWGDVVGNRTRGVACGGEHGGKEGEGEGR